MNEANNRLLLRTRRQLFKDCALGMGTLALAGLLPRGAFAGEPPRGPMAPKVPHFAPKAKRVIYLFMNGAPSQLDLFDDKPFLRAHDREAIPEEFTKGERFAFIRGTPKLLASPYKFAKHGACGAEISELLPHTATIADEIAIVKSLQTDQFNHAPAELFINSGHARIGRASMGSWVTYGLGSECSDLPGFVVLLSGGGQPSGGHSCWSSGFLPTLYQGVQFRSAKDPVLFVNDPPGMSRDSRRAAVEAIADLNRVRLGAVGDPEIATRIASFEMAYRMQSSVPDLTDLSKEDPKSLEAYGAEAGKPSFAMNCVLARRMIERGVRFVQLYHRGWDSHGTSPGDDIVTSLKDRC
ncbi:MAG: DUF1501 domain-containing protein, partial [Phycisphaerales bacterium]